jgi:L-alanine-DL-glutamate epimerase-like enolase superfamily enzyme
LTARSEENDDPRHDNDDPREIRDVQMTIPTRPSWGTEFNEKAARAHVWPG